MSKITFDSLAVKKRSNTPIVMLTAYDYPMADIIDKSGVDIVLVGDSLANVALGLESTTSVGMKEMLHHAKAVRRAIKRSILIGDMPYSSYQVDCEAALNNAKSFIKEAGCDGVKFEWFGDCPKVVEEVVKTGIPVMGHIGLTPQTAQKKGGFKVQGKDADAARNLIDSALLLQELGVFSIVLECVPDTLAQMITEKLRIPTIGIGAGPWCDGQVLVTNDLIGFSQGFKPKFVKQYIDLTNNIRGAVQQFCQEVADRKFPSNEHSYIMSDDELGKLKAQLSENQAT
ncbi:3-methyl-2-oxobutanoate hydroxymethyltransferase [Candidatus Omnitrophota bacterium]